MHFLTVVLVDPETDDVKEAVSSLVAPYDENLPTEEHEWNPDGQWDWWRVGGRFNGMIIDKPRRSDDGFCFAAGYESIVENSIRH